MTLLSLTLARLDEMTQDVCVFVWLCVLEWRGGGVCVCVVCLSVWCRHHCFQKMWGAGQRGQVESLTGVTHAFIDNAGV